MLLFLAAAMPCLSQNYIQGSILKGSASNSVDIKFLPNFNRNTGEYVNYLSISIAIDTGKAAGVTPSLSMNGTFTGMSMTPGIPASYTAGAEKIFSWVYSSGPTSMSWSNGTAFTGATITFTGGSDSTKVRLVDFTNYSPTGGANSNTYFLVVSNNNPYDLTNYSNLFYSISGTNGSSTGTYGNGDQYVETSLKIDMDDFSNPFAPITTEDDIQAPQENRLLKIYPSPAQGEVNLTMESSFSQTALVVITDMGGRVVMNRNVNLVTGNNKLTIPTSSLGTGIYNVELTCKTGCKKLIGRFVKR